MFSYIPEKVPAILAMIRVAGICKNSFFSLYVLQYSEGQDFLCATVLVAYISTKQNLFFFKLLYKYN